MTTPEPLSHEWRLRHVEMGDAVLKVAGAELDPRLIEAWASIAQAHYLAANVRARRQENYGTDVPVDLLALRDSVPCGRPVATGCRTCVECRKALATRSGVQL